MKSRRDIENRDADLPDQKYIGTTPVEPESAIARGEAPAASERSIDHETTPPPVDGVSLGADVTAGAEVVTAKTSAPKAPATVSGEAVRPVAVAPAKVPTASKGKPKK